MYDVVQTKLKECRTVTMMILGLIDSLIKFRAFGAELDSPRNNRHWTIWNYSFLNKRRLQFVIGPCTMSCTHTRVSLRQDGD